MASQYDSFAFRVGAGFVRDGMQRPLPLSFRPGPFPQDLNPGTCTVFSYERHMYVALAVVVIAIVAVVSMVVLDIPIPFLSK